jgi:pyridoxamine 5'-phosphate oxidase
MSELSQIRREYGEAELNENDLRDSPVEQLKLWLEQAFIDKEDDPNAFVLSTVDKHGEPDSRVVLLKEIKLTGELFFFTNYNSPKAQHIAAQPVVSAAFYWPKAIRQVRIKGHCKKISFDESQKYFSTRPMKSQLAAAVSKQSEVLASRAELENQIKSLSEDSQLLTCPECWGGYQITALQVEFFQGRNNRLNERVAYYLIDNQWKKKRLWP